ncbi:hypothetical protein [Brucella intermedia]|uniref:hypothetical protein n=1 Tax=Brucella intermedia TaxID=94625 RepID=UPI00224B93B9|nr:hypothetical protein [Brucella intermedia]
MLFFTLWLLIGTLIIFGSSTFIGPLGKIKNTWLRRIAIVITIPIIAPAAIGMILVAAGGDLVDGYSFKRCWNELYDAFVFDIPGAIKDGWNGR